MTELIEIHIRTRPPLTNFTTETLKDNRGLVIRIGPKIQPSSPSPTSSMRMQQQLHTMDPVMEDIETCGHHGMIIDDNIEEEEDCNDVFGRTTTTSSMPSPLTSHHTIPTTCASSTPIAIPCNNPSTHHSSPSDNNSPHRRLSSGTTPPHHNSYLMRVSPWAPCEPNSPASLSSGYGSSSPRLLTASTQTPPMFTFDIRLRLTNSPLDSATIRRSPSADLRRERLRQQILQTGERRPRYHSEGSGTDAVQAAVSESEDPSNPSQPLPDLVNNTAFRPRANTEPSRPRPEIEVGEQLRRISDEFHVSYEEIRRIRRRQENQGWLSRVIEHFRGRPHHDEMDEERPQAAAAKHVRQNQQ